MIRFLLPLAFLFLSSCGLRVTNFVDDNVLVGNWTMTQIVCLDANRENELEVYALDSSTSSQIEFGASNFSYSVSASSCNSSAVGRYSTEFEGDNTDILDMGSITVSTDSCDVSITDSGVNTVGTVSVDFDLSVPSAIGLTWDIETLASGTTTLTLDLFTLFEGSTDGDGCGGQTCICVAEFNKN